jgi:NOL1/NOP2/fmu family ribosome biogenesis protein
LFALKILNGKERKELLRIIKDQWEADISDDFVFLLNNRQRVYIVTRDIGNIDFEKLRINSVGLYFGELIKHELRLSIEGSQIVGPKAARNVVLVSNQQMKSWLFGSDIEIDTDSEGFVILKCGNDFIGCGRCSKKKIKNFVPKTRRIKTED